MVARPVRDGRRNNVKLIYIYSYRLGSYIAARSGGVTNKKFQRKGETPGLHGQDSYTRDRTVPPRFISGPAALGALVGRNGVISALCNARRCRAASCFAGSRHSAGDRLCPISLFRLVQDPDETDGRALLQSRAIEDVAIVHEEVDAARTRANESITLVVIPARDRAPFCWRPPMVRLCRQALQLLELLPGMYDRKLSLAEHVTLGVDSIGCLIGHLARTRHPLLLRRLPLGRSAGCGGGRGAKDGGGNGVLARQVPRRRHRWRRHRWRCPATIESSKVPP